LISRRSDRLGSEPDDFGIALDLRQYRERVVAIESASLMVVQMKKLAGLAATALALGTVQASAAEVAMRRVFSCVGPDAKMEIYIPESLWNGLGVQNAKLDKQATGAYSLDLTDAGTRCWSPSTCNIPTTRSRWSSPSTRAGCRRRRLRSAAPPSISISVSGRRRSADRSIRNEFGSSARTARVARGTPDAHNFSNWR
jgi:hypothetical protein